MKRAWKIIWLSGLIFCCTMQIHLAAAQSADVEQLILDVEKLTQFKQILSDMKTGYEIFDKGYSAIRDISKGNFSLHEAFIDGLLLVNPSILNYPRVEDIFKEQADILSEYKSAFSYFKINGKFTPDEISYMGKVYSNLFNRSLDNINRLTTVLTASKLRMSDDERITAINRLYADTNEMWTFLKGFDNKASILDKQRKSEQSDISAVKKLQEQ